MILFWDTETTGLPNYSLPVDHDDQPYLVQLACLLTEDDGVERGSFSLIVKAGISIPESAAAVHGITNQIAERAGIPSHIAVAAWNNLARQAETLVAHNVKFDLMVIRAAWNRARHGWRSMPPFQEPHGARTRFCTMEAAAPIMNLPPTERMIAAGFNKPKAPKLEECVQHFFGENLNGAHDAMVDVRACARVYFYLRDNLAEKAT